MKIKKNIILVFALFCANNFFFLFSYAGDSSKERITSFKSEISVNKDSTITVTETIRVISSGDQIKRGIYRDFPTQYKDEYGNNHMVSFEVLKVLRDGQEDDYHINALTNGKRLYIGNKNVFLSPGEYSYSITYKTDRQLGFFKNFDELYWNVTGNGWSFPMDEVSAIVSLPEDLGHRIIEATGYTGYAGSREQAVTVTKDNSGKVVFTATRQLYTGEGLTIVVTWPKGYIKEPDITQKLGYILRDNLGGIAAVFSLIIVIGYFLFVWSRVGKDPAKGTIIPLYKPPEDLSPAVMRYIFKMGFDYKIVAAAIINMAVKGYINISEESGVYRLTRKKETEGVLTVEEKEFAQRLFGSDDEIDLKNTHYNIIGAAIRFLQTFLKNCCEKIYFITNKEYFIKGFILSVALMFVSIAMQALSVHQPEKMIMAFFMCLWLSGWTAGVVALLCLVFSIWRTVKANVVQFGQAIFLTLFSIPFVAGEIIGVGIFVFATSILVACTILAVIFINILFYRLLKAPTLKGRKMLDRIEGFKMYLGIAEKDRINILNPPDKTPEVFEKYLPYALALDVEQQWAEKFSDVLSKATVNGQAYQPCWYSGSAWHSLGAGAFVSGLGSSFSNAISSSATAPGSSSGSGGGGSSGGGGGGGGGGGW